MASKEEEGLTGGAGGGWEGGAGEVVRMVEVIAISDEEIVRRMDGLREISIQTEMIFEEDSSEGRSMEAAYEIRVQYQQSQDDTDEKEQISEQVVDKVQATSQMQEQSSPSQDVSPAQSLPISVPSSFSNNISSSLLQTQSDSIIQQSFSQSHVQELVSSGLPSASPSQIGERSQPQPSYQYNPKKSLIQMLYFEQQSKDLIVNEQHKPIDIQSEEENLYPSLIQPLPQTLPEPLPNQSSPIYPSFSKLSSPTRTKQIETPIITPSLSLHPHPSTPLAPISLPADQPLSAVSEYIPAFQQQFIEQYSKYVASKETVNPSPPLSPFSPRTQATYQQNFINNLPFSYQQSPQAISRPLSHFPMAEFVASLPSETQTPPEPIDIKIKTFSSALPISPPIIEKQPEKIIKTDEQSIRKTFERINFPSTQCRIVGNHRFIQSPTDKTDEFSAQELLATLNSLPIPKPSSRVDSLDIQQVDSERKLLTNIKLFNTPHNKIDSIVINPSRSRKEVPLDTKPVPFQQQLKFNIEKEFPVSTESQVKYLPQNEYNFNQSISSNLPVNNNYSYQQSDYNIPINWLYKESLKITPRMNFSYIYPKVSLETPNYNNSYEHGHMSMLREEKEIPASGGRSIKISLCSPKAPKIQSNEGKAKRNFIKLKSPQRNDVFHSRQKRLSPAIEPGSDFRSNQANSYQQNSGASPKKKKLKLVQKAKAPFPQPLSVPQKQISLFEQDSKPARISQKIKITLKSHPLKPVELDASHSPLGDESQILIEYHQDEKPIRERIN